MQDQRSYTIETPGKQNPLEGITFDIFISAGHWQNKPYPYAPYLGRTLGDGTLLGLDMSTDYYWCWIGLGVNLAYILLLNAMIVTLLAFLPAYGAHATVAKTSEELEDRRKALYGDEGTDASDIVVNFQMHDDGVAGQNNGLVNGHSNGQDHNRIQVLILLSNHCCEVSFCLSAECLDDNHHHCVMAAMDSLPSLALQPRQQVM